MQEIDFDTPIDRSRSGCIKYDLRLERFGRADIIPLWVADMDFAAPACVRQALAERLAHSIFGYSQAQERLFESIHGWFARRHQWRIDSAQLMLTPGVVPSLYAAVQALTAPGDAVLVPSPVYPPFLSAVTQTDRHLIQSPLIKTETDFEFDFEHLEKQATEARMLLLCSPHNPLGRLWREEELNRLVDIALRHDLVLVSDEIHCDLGYPNTQHLCLARIAPPEFRLLTAISPSKSFNIPGLNLSALVTAQEADRKALEDYFERQHLSPFNPLTMAAFTAAYEKGDAWLDSLRAYLAGNRDLVAGFLEREPRIRCHLPEATCLMWLDCRELGLKPKALRDFFIHKAGLGLNEGPSFGQGGEGFMRLNIGTQRRVLETALRQLAEALASL